ncbi:hypothetical protein B2G71_07300 [Novosphingobium sp. PC22D]|uniref:alpha/beta hydrolase family protein n=1 Tax=Novosphingobium sp. PC22D TaxID=1962403 RepID=UPI000BFB0026|nr:acyl-CoA thioester hydrolase/BAAT C-terminal domain-containing protein [Novosphingobium sp. PC22D]PEQ13238.1 hypothetical protein B2G71_07300 [Novosphingobium sp. PC22D]
MRALLPVLLPLCAALVPVAASAQGFAPPITVADVDASGTRVTINGLPGNWYPASGEGEHPAILMLGGSEGGLTQGSDREARALRERGYNVLYQSYYRTSQDNADFSMVPLETFDMAIDWLKAQPSVDPERIGIVGGSKGAEAALITAARRPEIKAVVAAMPSNAMWAGFSFTMKPGVDYKSSWSLGGEPVAFMPYGAYTPGEPMVTMYANGLAASAGHADALIPVENIAGPVLLICGEDDTLWPSCPMARSLKARAEAEDGPDVEVAAYEDAGHAVFGSPLPQGSDLSRLTYFGGTGEGNNAARKDSMGKMEAFLDAVLSD